MPEQVTVAVNGQPVAVTEGMTVIAAIVASGGGYVRRSISGEARGALCAMGICFECRATINGEQHCRSCQILCRREMDIRTDE